MPSVLSPALLAAFVAVTMVAYVVPGPDWLIIFQLASRRRTAGFAAALGTQTSLCVHMLFAIVGVSALLLRFPVALTALKFLGAAYLIYLGIRILLSTRRDSGPGSGAPQAPDAGPTLRSAFFRGFGTNILNPKAALFFLSVVPQFLDPTSSIPAQILLLGVLDVVLGVMWWTVFVLAAERMGVLLARPRARKRVDAATGAALVLVGIAVPLL